MIHPLKRVFKISIFFLFAAAVFPPDFSFGQYADFGIIEAVNDSGSFQPVPLPDRVAVAEPSGVEKTAVQLSAEQKQKLITDLKESVVKQIKANWYKPSSATQGIVRELGRAQSEGVLEPTIVAIFTDPRIMKLMGSAAASGKMPPEEIARTFALYMGAELESNGYVEGVAPLESWDEMTVRHLALARSGSYASPRKGQASLLGNPGFLAELQGLQNTAFAPSNKIEILVDGPASFSKREQLIKSAQKNIYLATWAFYDDETGESTAELLIAKKKQGLDVKVIVDEDTSKMFGGKVLEKMKKAGIEVVRFQLKDKPYYEYHSKILATDGKYAILGGMNIGNHYSHADENGEKWRDTDIFVQGPVLAQAFGFFAQTWNSQVAEHGLPYGKVSPSSFDASPAGQANAAVVWNAPGAEPYILLSMLKAVYGSSERINIENAIIVMIPAMRQALLDALSRGVEVNILSNSADTIGDKLMSNWVLGGFPELMKAGAKVYLKQGWRLHSKFMTVDGLYGTVGSFNLQPRSTRYVQEITVNFTDKQAVAELDKAFKADISSAKKAEKKKDLDIPYIPMTDLIKKLMFNQL